MKFRLRQLFASLALSLCLLMGLAAPAYAAATCGSGDNTAKGQVLSGAGETGDDCTGVGATNVVGSVISILSLVVGIVAVVMIIVAGLRYVTSGGDSAKVTSAKNALIYALIGLFVASLAQTLVRFVFDNAVKS